MLNRLRMAELLALLGPGMPTLQQRSPIHIGVDPGKPGGDISALFDTIPDTRVRTDADREALDKAVEKRRRKAERRAKGR